jgi:Cytochrome c.
MIDQTPIARKAFLSALIIVVLSFGNKLVAQNGKALFQENCARCHNLTKDMVGPKMEGIQDRVPDRELLKAWIKNSTDVIASGNEYFNDLFKRYNNTPMPPFTHFTDADLEALVDYITTPPPAPKVEGGGSAPVEEQDNSILYGILTLILAVVALIMLQVNSSLQKTTATIKKAFLHRNPSVLAQ